MQYPFGPFEPDAGATSAGKLRVADGVLPKVEGWGPAPQLVEPSGAVALPADPRGAITCVKRDGTTVVFFFTAATVQQLETNYSFTQIESGLSTTSGDDWSSDQFDNQLLYTNTTQGLRAYNIESGGAASAISAAGNPREVFAFANRVAGLDCLDDTSTRDNRLIRISAAGDHTNWTTREADQKHVYTGGELLAGFALMDNAAIICQRNALRLLTVGGGGGSPYNLTDIANGRGIVGKRSAVAFDGVLYALAPNGFFRFSGGGLEWIGAGRVDEWFLARVVTADLVKVQAAIDPSRKIVLWRYPMTTDASSTVTEHVIGYSWAFDRWFTWTQTIAYLSRIAPPGYTLTSWEAAFATLLASPDIPIGDRFWQGGKTEILITLGSTLKYAAVSGTPQAVSIETTASSSPVSGLIGRATPIDDAANSTLALGVSDALSNAMTWKAAAAKQPSGRVPLRGRGKNIAFRYAIAAGETWTEAKGVDHIEAEAGGRR